MMLERKATYHCPSMSPKIPPILGKVWPMAKEKEVLSTISYCNSLMTFYEDDKKPFLPSYQTINCYIVPV